MPIPATTNRYDEYLAEIRRQVCSRCVERPPGGPPCAPLGKTCGVELHFPHYIEAVQAVKSGRIDPYLDNLHHDICEQCVRHNENGCPCPLDYLSILLVEAIETVDQRRQCEPVTIDPGTPRLDDRRAVAIRRAVSGKGTQCADLPRLHTDGAPSPRAPQTITPLWTS